MDLVLLLLVLIGGPILAFRALVLLPLAAYTKGWRAAISKYGISLALLVLLPADAVIGRVYLGHLCKVEGGLKVHKTVDEVEGVFKEGHAFDDGPKYYGYKFVEGTSEKWFRSSSGVLEKRGVARVTLVEGKPVREDPAAPRAVYEFYGSPDIDDGPYFYKTRHVVRIKSTQEELGGWEMINFRGGWIEQLGRLEGPSFVAQCDAPKDRHLVALRTILRPEK